MNMNIKLKLAGYTTNNKVITDKIYKEMTPDNKQALEIQKAFKAQVSQIPESSKSDARILMYRFLSEVERITDERSISRKELAKLAGTSPSYITQLYQGNKIASLEFLTKLERALGFQFNISVTADHSK